MLKKIIKGILITSITCFTLNAQNIDYKALEKNNVADMSKFQHLKINKGAEDYSYLKNKEINNDFVNDIVNNNFQGFDFLTKKEFRSVNQKIQKIQKELDKERDFILYFTSTSVPKQTMYNILFQVGILQENGFDILTKQYFIGFPENFEDYMISIKDDINKKPLFERKKIIDNSGIKVDPRFFEYFGLKKVPALALAHCKGIKPTFNTCEFKFLLRGDTSLESFFDKIRKLDKKYEPYYEALLANKFENKEVTDHEKEK